MDENSVKIEPPKHHKQQNLCTTRPLYRQGRKLTAVKVYTINNESQHLLVYGVPLINLRHELKGLFGRYGTIKMVSLENKYKTEIFTECYHVHYERIQSARIAKRFLDNRSFYGGIIHVCYAPELETINETRMKLEQRKKDIYYRLNKIQTKSVQQNTQDLQDLHESPQPIYKTSSTVVNRKRKYPAIRIDNERLKKCNIANVWHGIPENIDPRISTQTDLNSTKHFVISKVPTNSSSDGVVASNSVVSPSKSQNVQKEISIPNNKSISNTPSNNKLNIKSQISKNVKRIVFLNNKNT